MALQHEVSTQVRRSCSWWDTASLLWELDERPAVPTSRMKRQPDFEAPLMWFSSEDIRETPFMKFAYSIQSYTIQPVCAVITFVEPFLRTTAFQLWILRCTSRMWVCLTREDFNITVRSMEIIHPMAYWISLLATETSIPQVSCEPWVLARDVISIVDESTISYHDDVPGISQLSNHQATW